MELISLLINLLIRVLNRKMPWKVKRQFYLILLGTIAMALAIVVFIRDSSIDTRLLSGVGFAGGLAIIINLLPSNGHQDEEGKK